MNKDEIFTFTKERPECALRLIKKGNWPMRLIEALDTDLAIINDKGEVKNKLDKSVPDDGSYVDVEGFHWARKNIMVVLLHMSHDFFDKAYKSGSGSVRTIKHGNGELFCIEDFKELPEYVDRQSRVLKNEAEHQSFMYKGEEYISLKGLCEIFKVNNRSSLDRFCAKVPEDKKIQIQYFHGGKLMVMPAYQKNFILDLPEYMELTKLKDVPVEVKDQDGFYTVDGTKYGLLIDIVKYQLKLGDSDFDPIKVYESVRSKIKSSAEPLTSIKLREGGIFVDMCYAIDDIFILRCIAEYKPAAKPQY